MRRAVTSSVTFFRPGPRHTQELLEAVKSCEEASTGKIPADPLRRYRAPFSAICRVLVARTNLPGLEAFLVCGVDQKQMSRFKDRGLRFEVRVVRVRELVLGVGSVGVWAA